MKYPKYGAWCKQNVIETIRKKKIHESKKYLDKFIFDPNSDLFSTGVYDYEISDILWLINGDPDNPSKSLFLAVQHAFAEKYFQMAQEMNPQTDIRTIRRNDSEYMDLLYRTLENDITMDELKDAVLYAYKYGTEELEETKIPYVRTVTENIAKAIKSNLTKIESVHINYLDPEAKRKEIPVNEFKDYLIHLSRSGIFAEAIKWRYVDLFDSGRFLIEGDISHNNGYELNVAIAVKNKEDKVKIVAILKMEEQIV